MSEPLPIDGYVTLPHDKPGWGLELNRAKLNLVRPFGRSEAPGAGVPVAAAATGSVE